MWETGGAMVLVYRGYLVSSHPLNATTTATTSAAINARAATGGHMKCTPAHTSSAPTMQPSSHQRRPNAGP